MAKKRPRQNLDRLLAALLLALLALFGTMTTIFALGFALGSRL